MNDSEDRYDRFVSEMTVHKTIESAWATVEERKHFMERMRQERKKRRKANEPKL